MTDKHEAQKSTCEAHGCVLPVGHKGRHWASWMGNPRPGHECKKSPGCVFGEGHEEACLKSKPG